MHDFIHNFIIVITDPIFWGRLITSLVWIAVGVVGAWRARSRGFHNFQYCFMSFFYSFVMFPVFVIPAWALCAGLTNIELNGISAQGAFVLEDIGALVIIAGWFYGLTSTVLRAGVNAVPLAFCNAFWHAFYFSVFTGPLLVTEPSPSYIRPW